MIDTVAGSMPEMQFLKLSINADYNNNMNSVDIIDQIHNQYLIDYWIKK